MTISAQVTTRSGTVLATYTTDDLVAARFTEQENELGEGAITIAYDNDDEASLTLDATRLVHIRHNAVRLYTYELRALDIIRMNPREERGRVIIASGPGVGILLGDSQVGGAVVYPGCGDPGAFQSDTRFFGWMDCCCFNHSAHGFTSPPGMVHRQDSPDLPWEPDQPDGWPDGVARRIHCASPTVVTAGANEVQEINLGTSIDSGTFTLVFEGEETANISSPWSAANVETALEALSTIDGVTVTGAGLSSDPYIVTFDTGNVAQRNVPLLEVHHDQLNHPPQTASVTTTTQGKKGKYQTAAGCCYFHDTFTTTQDRSLVAFINMAPTGEVFLDGVSIHTQSTGSTSAGMRTVNIDLPAGDHCITAKVCKKGSSGLAWFMYTLAEAVENDDGEWELGTVFHRTDASWSVLSTTFSAPPPGATVGEIVDCLYNEARLLPNPDLDDVTLDITSAVDSDAVSWSDEFIFGVPIGTGYLDVIQQLVDLTGITWRVNDDLSVSIWQDRGTDRTATVAYTEGTAAGGILESSYSGEGVKASTLLVETQDGVTEAADAAGLTAYGSRRIGVTLGTAPTYEGLADFATQTFRTFARAVWTLALTTHGPTGLEPYTNFDISDVLTAPHPRTGGATPFRNTQLQMQMDDDGYPIWTVFLTDEGA